MTPRGPGRPSVQAERRAQIIDAFIILVAERGLQAVTLTDVAERAGVMRPAIRHHVGNRDELIAATFETLAQRYDKRAAQEIGQTPTIDSVVAYLFGDAYTSSSDIDDQAFNAFLGEARRNEGLAVGIHATYTGTINTIADVVFAERPEVAHPEAQALAYQVLCLAEFNVDMQRLGFVSEWSRATADTADQILRTGRAPHAAPASSAVRG
ncbi:MAG: TetR/AcrR family transcriptional regulator [Actinomycetota bacterium]